LFDIVMDSLARIDKNKAYQHIGDIRDGLIELMTSDQEFINSIELSTSSSQAVKARFVKWNAKLQEIIKDHTPEQRFFPWNIKEQLFNRRKMCAICNNQILDIDDAHVDHIVPYSKGGTTTLENAQLTHKYCNLVKSDSLLVQPFSRENNTGDGTRTSLPRGCTVNRIHYESANDAVAALCRDGVIQRADVPTSSYNAHDWLLRKHDTFGCTYIRDES
jgi:HNH endonuclease